MYFKPKIKNHNKPWITSGITISVKKKNKLYEKFCQAQKKSELHKQYKVYKNHIMNLLERAKSRFKNLFEENKCNSFKIWQRIQKLSK